MNRGSTLYKLLALLADGEWHSGEDLGERLSISRAAVAKQLKQLEGLGLSLETIRGTGYRLNPKLDLLEKQRVVQAATRWLTDNTTTDFIFNPDRLEIHTEIASTNEELMTRLRANQQVHANVCFAECQTQGRGRRGRAWHSPFAQNIYMSVGWHFDAGISAIEGLSLAVGVIICRVLNGLGVADVGLKWPNDILVGGKKLGGVLIELGGDAVSNSVAVVGVGLNVSMPRSADSDIDQPWCALVDLGYRHGRNELAGRLAAGLSQLLDGYALHTFAAYSEEWNSLDAFSGQNVALVAAQSRIVGKMIGVSDHGALRLETPTGIEEFVGGELSLRLDA